MVDRRPSLPRVTGSVPVDIPARLVAVLDSGEKASQLVGAAVITEVERREQLDKGEGEDDLISIWHRIMATPPSPRDRQLMRAIRAGEQRRRNAEIRRALEQLRVRAEAGNLQLQLATSPSVASDAEIAGAYNTPRDRAISALRSTLAKNSALPPASGKWAADAEIKARRAVYDLGRANASLPDDLWALLEKLLAAQDAWDLALPGTAAEEKAEAAVEAVTASLGTWIRTHSIRVKGDQ